MEFRRVLFRSMKDDCSSTVWHELRTPLATIRGFTELLGPSSDVTDDVRVQVIDRIRRGTHRLERLVANLLEVSRIEGRRSSTAPPADLDLRSGEHTSELQSLMRRSYAAFCL